MTTASMRCACGAVEGTVSDAGAGTANRVTCYCDDCQAFAHHLGRAQLLDAHGGSDIIQVAPASLTLTRGKDHVAGVRLSPKGLYRWHTTCCRTPVGNTVSPKVPFVGLMAQTFEHAGQSADQIFGRSTGAILGQYATGEVPKSAHGMPLRIVVTAVFKVARWRLNGKAWPNPFFERGRASPLYPLRVLTPAERDALRPLCGPHAMARSRPPTA